MGLGAPLPLHSTSSPAKLFFSSAPCYLLPTHTLYSCVLRHFAKCSWDYLGIAPTQSCSILQRYNPGFIKLSLKQQRTAREINFEMFPLKCTLSKPCTVDRNQCFFNAKAIPPSRGLVGEAPKRQTWEKPRLNVQPLLSPLLLVVPILPRCSCITYVSLSAVHTCISQG